MTETAKQKPLWWRVGKGKWHEDPLTYQLSREPMPPKYVQYILDRQWLLWSLCNTVYGGVTNPVIIRRSAPPVAQQCKRCRAAKAQQRKEKCT